MSAATIVAFGGAFVLFGAPDGYPADRTRLRSGAAWLPSAAVGQLSLLDGSSGEVAAQVQVANRGERLDAVQQDSTAYAVNATTGMIRRVDGATFVVSAPKAPIPNAGEGLMAVPGHEALYVLDTGRGVLTGADPRTLAARGATVPLAAGIAPETTVIDDRGRLWVLNRTSGDLTWVDNDGHRDTHTGIARSGQAILTLAGGTPVVVDPARATAVVVDPDSGAASRRLPLDLQGDEKIQVGRSSSSRRLYVVNPRGTLVICDLAASSCGRAVPLDAGGDLGTPVESGDHLFIPDYATGKVWIVDLTRARVSGQADVLTPKTRFQLLTRDGMVFFNDPNSEHAGVINLDGTVRHCRKYDPKDPSAGLQTSGTGSAKPSPSPSPRTSTSSRLSPQPPRSSGPTNSSSSSSSATIAPSSPRSSSAAPVELQLSASTTSALVGEDVTLRAALTGGGSLRSVQWTFGDGRTEDGVTVTHQWSGAQTYQVSAQATLTDGRTGSSSIPIQISVRPTLTVNVTTAGTVTGGGITCPGTCQVTATGGGQQITLTAAPATNYIFAGWSGACSGTAASCTVAMTASRSVTATFRLPTPVLQYPTNNVQIHKPSTYDRQLSLTWNSIPGAVKVRVELDYCPHGSTQWTHWKTVEEPLDGNMWDTWPGPYKGRWRVTALAADGQSSSAPSDYGTFDYVD